MKKIFTLLFFTGSIITGAIAQQGSFQEIKYIGGERCGFDKVLEKAHFQYEAVMKNYETIIAQSKMGAPQAKTTDVVYDIPVVFHVVYNAGMPSFNIPDSVLINQISVLNKAYRKTHSDTGNTRAIFKSLSKDAEIQFHLATKDPSGNPTTGITRTISSHVYFGSSSGMPDMDSFERVKKTASGGIDPWPVTKYLNIWVTNLTDNQGQLSVLGYAIPPLNPIPNNWPAGSDAGLAGFVDGVVLQAHAVGDNNALSAQLQGTYTKGRCAVHEVGHYLGLMHIFGGTSGSSSSDCGTAIVSDGIGDTPEQSLISVVQGGGCASATKNSCGAGVAGDLPDMWENYMDYTNDVCQTMFTNDQIVIMRSVMANQRNPLNDPNVSAVPSLFRKEITIYPNPAKDKLTLSYDGTISSVQIFNFLGSVVYQVKGNQLNSKEIYFGNLPKGNYIIKAQCADGEVLAGKFTVME